jgi:hypothetical protein
MLNVTSGKKHLAAKSRAIRKGHGRIIGKVLLSYTVWKNAVANNIAKNVGWTVTGP